MRNHWVSLFALLGATFTGQLSMASPVLDQTRGKFVAPPAPVPAITSELQGKYQFQDFLPAAAVGTAADLQALEAVETLNALLKGEFSLFEYKQALYSAQIALGVASRSESSIGLASLRSAVAAHRLAYEFWKTCGQAPNEFMCDENRAPVAEVLRLYAKPRAAEKIASVEEISLRYPKPWVETRVRATLREVVEYIPMAEQKRVMRLLWKRALQDTEQAAIGLGRS